MVERAALQAQLLEVLPGPPDHRPRRYAEQLHDRVAVQVGADPGQVLLGRDPGDPLLQRVVVGGELGRLAPVAGGAVRAGQLVQPGQQVTGVGDVPAHRRVGPLAPAVPVEAQVQRDQLGHLGDDVLRVAHRLHPGLGQPRADHLVVVEADPTVRADRLGRRLAHVVHQRGHPQHEVAARPSSRPTALLDDGQGVLVDVLVLGVLVDLQLAARSAPAGTARPARCRPAAAAR